MIPLKTFTLFVPAMVLIGACDGPKEQAGRERDRAEAAAAGRNITGQGPNQQLGEAQDRVDRADRKAKDAQAAALESRGDQVRKQADIEADKLDDQARTVRDTKK